MFAMLLVLCVVVSKRFVLLLHGLRKTFKVREIILLEIKFLLY